MSTHSEPGQDPGDFSHDGLGPVPAFTSAQHLAARTVLLAHVEDDLRASAQALAAGQGAERRTVPDLRPGGRRWAPARAGARPPVWSRRRLVAGLSAASIAAMAAGAVHLGGGFDTGESGDGSIVAAAAPVLPMSAVAYTLPSAAVTTDRSRCTTSKGSPADGDGLRYLLNEATAQASGSAAPSLTYSLIRTNNCFTSGWPTASFVATTADGRRLTRAITVWGAGVQGLSAPSSDNRVRATAVGDYPARVLNAHWGVLESWITPEGTWSITAAGADEATVQRLAETVAATHGAPDTAELQAQLPGLRAVPVPAPPPPPYSTFYATYGAESTGSDVTDRLELDVSQARVPWAAWASTGPLDGTKLVDVNGVTGWSVQDAGDPLGMLVWEVAPGVNALLRGQVGGSKDLTPYARQVQEVTVDDPRLRASDLNH